MINKDYLYIQRSWDINTINIESDCLYLFAKDKEIRCDYCALNFKKRYPNASFIELTETNDSFKSSDNPQTIISLTDDESIIDWLKGYNKRTIYIDVTGMSCRLVAPILLYTYSVAEAIHVIYVEPAEYDMEKFKEEGVFQDLSEQIDGIDPLPCFKTIVPRKEAYEFVVLLGFEGCRFSHMLLNQQPPTDAVTPIIGVPGYRLEYPYDCYFGNSLPMISSKSWRKATLVSANSIVDSYLKLKEIASQHRKSTIVIAPIGTKPHAIGAILYAIKNRRNSEILYDNPIRDKNRTKGIGRIIDCNITKLLNENP